LRLTVVSLSLSLRRCLSLSLLLRGHSSYSRYVQKVEGVHAMQMIGQRLFSGRIAVAMAAVEFTRSLFAETEAHTDTKMCWSPAGEMPLSSIPQLKLLYREAKAKVVRLDRLLALLAGNLSQYLAVDGIPPPILIEHIAVAKVKAVEQSIDLCFRLKQEVGSYALMAGTGFEKMDFLQCCKFAEGDSRILMQKLTRDRLKRFAKHPPKPGSAPGADAVELAMCSKLGMAMASGDPGVAWDDSFETVYTLAEAVMARTMDELVPMSKA
jgi:hypothetical protein